MGMDSGRTGSKRVAAAGGRVPMLATDRPKSGGHLARPAESGHSTTRG
eukprot:CAMPEP_0178986482 /NCGR_PEP_ID=MMETSP0795-20121207/2724_1 /TAXON_ID=88552 /ORGANISM="Amoebophrya sp., Strain Ameob2" /LENGTH=47 /DNA_ID= /DNA_START= /DNA_END= /DNA_ORIENTATION=